jgi:ketosteroid isomerase-like protein
LLDARLALIMYQDGVQTPRGKSAMDARAEDVKAILELERQAREAAGAKDLDRYVSFYADNASLFWPGTPTVTGRVAILDFMRAFLSMPAC